MTYHNLTNFASAVLSGDFELGDTTLSLASGHTSLPTTNFWATVFSDDPGDMAEIIHVSTRSGSTLTGITRAQQGTVERDWYSGDKLIVGYTAANHTEILAALIDPDSIATGTTSPTKYGIITIDGTQYKVALEEVT